MSRPSLHWNVGGWNWHPDREGRSAPLPLTGRVHGASVQLHELPDDGQPETEPAVWPRRGAISLTKALEYVWQKGGTDALTRVHDLHLHLGTRAFDGHIDASAFGRELDCI